MHLVLFDHLLAAAWVAAVPAFAAMVVMPRLRRQGERARRARTYVRTVAMQSTLTVLMLLLWRREERPWSDLGLRAPDSWRFLFAAVLVIVALGWLASLRRRARNDEAFRRELRPALEALRPLLPRTGGELAAFVALACTAGVAEELFFRGYLLAYLGAFAAPPVAWGTSVALFGAGHIYQGPRSVLQTAALGAVFLVLVALSGSIWLAMAFHAGFDIHSGVLGHALLRDERRGPVLDLP